MPAGMTPSHPGSMRTALGSGILVSEKEEPQPCETEKVALPSGPVVGMAALMMSEAPLK